jgi:AraC-like DNA-binding protein
MAMSVASDATSIQHPLLPVATGQYAERLPLESLREQFSRTWFNIFPDCGSPVAVVPDGSIDLQWIDGELRVAGPDPEVNCELRRPGTVVIGLRFHTGAASAWLHVPASAILGAREPLEAFWGSEARRIAAWAGGAADRAGVARRLESALAHRAASMPPPDPAASRIRRALEDAREPSIGSVRDLCAEVGLSERTLRRRCHEAFGYGPKTLQRIVRFQRLLRMTSANRAGAELATAAGYADQAHLVREARRMAAMTPTAIWEQLQR